MITKELVEQWVNAVADPDKVPPYQNGFWTLTDAETQAFAEKAAAHGSAQRDAELMAAADKKPVPDGKSNWDWTSIDHYNDGWNAKRDFDAARLQGSKPLTEKEILDEYCTTPGIHQFVSAFKAGVRFAEKHHGITGEEV